MIDVWVSNNFNGETISLLEFLVQQVENDSFLSSVYVDKDL